MSNDRTAQITEFIANFRNGIWLLGIPSWLFGITDRSLASLADGYLSAMDMVQIFTASLFFLSWLYLKPEETFQIPGAGTSSYQGQVQLCPFRAKMLELKAQHMISQEYILPFSYICQIYHLLNLKHLESVHSFSLNNLKVMQVTEFQQTSFGGKLKFKTILDSPLNVLRIWRQPTAEASLTLHTPYTVELNIPVYGDKTIVVMFYVEPLSNNEHRLFIDIYSNLKWPKPILQILLHLASCLTLFEDLPYLRRLAERNIDRLLNLATLPTHDTMWLFRRFVELHHSTLEPSHPLKAIEQQ